MSIWWRGFGGRQDFPASSAEYSDFPQCAVFPKIAYSHCLPYPYVVLGSSLEPDSISRDLEGVVIVFPIRAARDRLPEPGLLPTHRPYSTYGSARGKG